MISFKGYNSYNASSVDPMRLKWVEMEGTTRAPLRSFTTDQFEDFNVCVNRLIAADDLESESLDAWQSPADTLKRGAGDCKDYALLKYAVLTAAGRKCCIVIGEIASISGNKHHAWCGVQVAGMDAWWVLDNKFDGLIRPDAYINWIPGAAMMADVVVRFGKAFVMADVLAGKG